jgi:phosphate starvation-inducible protein PhoH and related proteins
VVKSLEREKDRLTLEFLDNKPQAALGEDSQVVVDDCTQSDLPGGCAEGLDAALEILEGVEGVGVARFSEVDVVSHALVGRIVAAYDRKEAEG